MNFLIAFDHPDVEKKDVRNFKLNLWLLIKKVIATY